MPSFSSSLWSSVGKKVLMALTGLIMILFLIEHLAGNLLLYGENPDPFNEYSHFLISFGSILYVAELGLVALFLVHVVAAVSVWLGKRRARPDNYALVRSAGPPSRKTIYSTTMIYTGIVLFVFLVIHLKTFKYGPHYTTTVDGVEMRDLHKLVIEVFRQPGYVIGYVAVMILMGFHLRHAFWSAFQSLGVNHPRYSPLIYGLGIIIAVLLTVGFLGIPIWIYFREVLL